MPLICGEQARGALVAAQVTLSIGGSSRSLRDLPQLHSETFLKIGWFVPDVLRRRVPKMRFPVLSICIALMAFVAPGQALSAQVNGSSLTNVVSQQTCPVRMAAPTRSRNTLHLSFRNSSSKKIRGILFGAAYYDRNQVVHVIQVLADEHRIIQPGVVKTGDLDIRYWRNADFTAWSAWPSKILFTDGSSWQMGPNAMSCVATYRRDDRQPRMLLASDLHLDAPVEMVQAAEGEAGGGSDF
jgi:hypothetical protein